MISKKVSAGSQVTLTGTDWVGEVRRTANGMAEVLWWTGPRACELQSWHDLGHLHSLA